MPDLPWYLQIGLFLLVAGGILALGLAYKTRADRRPKDEEAPPSKEVSSEESGGGKEKEGESEYMKHLPIFVGAVLFIIGLIALYTAWPTAYLYARPDWYMWAIAILISAIALIPMEKKKMFMGFAVVAFSLALISHIYDKWDDQHKPKTHIISIDKNWSKWFTVSKYGKNTWGPDRPVGYEVMNPDGHITTYPATKNPNIHIPGFPDSLRFRTTNGGVGKIVLVVSN